MTIAFPPVTLPETAYRRSYFTGELLRLANVFADLLVRLAPRTYRSLSDKSPRSCYGALLDYLGDELFPVFYPFLDEDWWDNREGEDVAEMGYGYEAEAFGIPVEVFGLDEEDIMYVGSPALALAAYLCYPYGSINEHRPVIDDFTALKRFPELRKQYAGLFTVGHFDKAPRGRLWTPPWNALGLLSGYAQNNTGYRWLDYSHTSISEGGGYPPWALAEVRALAQEWKRIRPAFERLKALIAYIDERPNDRLPLLAGALCGEPQARLQISQPERG